MNGQREGPMSAEGYTRWLEPGTEGFNAEVAGEAARGLRRADGVDVPGKHKTRQ